MYPWHGPVPTSITRSHSHRPRAGPAPTCLPRVPAHHPDPPIASRYQNTLSSGMEHSTSCTSLEVRCPMRAPGGSAWQNRTPGTRHTWYLVRENPPAPLHPTRRRSPRPPSAEAGPRCPEQRQPSPPALREGTQQWHTGKGSSEPPPAQHQRGAAFGGSVPPPETLQGLVRGWCFATPCFARALRSHALESGPSRPRICLFS